MAVHRHTTRGELGLLLFCFCTILQVSEACFTATHSVIQPGDSDIAQDLRAIHGAWTPEKESRNRQACRVLDQQNLGPVYTEDPSRLKSTWYFRPAILLLSKLQPRLLFWDFYFHMGAAAVRTPMSTQGEYKD